MPTIHATATLPYTTNIPEDVVTNTLYFSTLNSTDPDNLNEIGARVIAAYHIIDTNLHNVLSRAANACRVDLYDLSDPEPRAPIADYTFTLDNAASGVTNLPLEVALCLSYHAAFVSGVPNARRRGRIYLGPFSTGASELTRPPDALIDLCVDFGEALWTPIGASDIEWVQHSETTGLSLEVIGGWVDNEWDTQRRRGRRATSRDLLGSPPA